MCYALVYCQLVNKLYLIIYKTTYNNLICVTIVGRAIISTVHIEVNVLFGEDPTELVFEIMKNIYQILPCLELLIL